MTSADKFSLTSWATPLLDFFFPPMCLGCGVFFDGASGICGQCFLAINNYELPICLSCLELMSGCGECSACSKPTTPLFSIADYNPTMREIIIHLKFKNITISLTTFALLLYEKFGEKIKQLKAEALVPIPLHPSREHERGYNQAFLLAEKLSEHLELPVNNSIIIRNRRGRPQANLKFNQRRDNIKGAFEVIEPRENQMRILLVDDVVTSGSTMNEAAKVLKEAGYKVVGAISIAHGI